MTTSVGNNSVFRSFFEKQKLTGPNFIDWYRQLRLVLSTKDKEKYMEQPILASPVTAAPDQLISPQALATYNEWVKNQKEIVVMMLLTMYLEIQRNPANLVANDMLTEPKAFVSVSTGSMIYSMAGEDENNDANIPPPVLPTQQQTPHKLSTIKLPILKKGEYDIWPMKIEHYLGNTDYPIWEVIQMGNVLRERKARTTLLMAIPEDHLAKFYKMTNAKKMWEAINSKFGGNDESKKMQKYILKQQFKSFSVSNSKGLYKGYDRSLPSSWSQVSLIMRTKPEVDSLSFDDLYNNLRVFEHDVKGSTTSSSNSHIVAFVSSESTNSTNEVSTAYGVSTSFGHNSQRESSSSYIDELMYFFVVNKTSGPQLDHEDLE
ncbi:hypothetical protein Tco_0219014 [Tanacetum coccineum]